MKLLHYFIGPRILKTGISVFLTAMVCFNLQLPAVFACITAIVTIEPTAIDSLKKGFIRIPAAAIGAAIALILDYFIGQSALTFALVAMLTILGCHRLKLDSGTLVATLTAVAMIPGLANEAIITEFVLRLSGTTLGIIIATLVNFFVLPPRFGPILVGNVNRLYKDAAFALDKHLFTSNFNVEQSFIRIRYLHKKLEKAFQVLDYLEKEQLYRKTNVVEVRSFVFLKRKLIKLQLIISHIVNICNIPIDSLQLTVDEMKTIARSINIIRHICLSPLETFDVSVIQVELMQSFQVELINQERYNPKLALFFEISAIVNCLDSLQLETMNEHEFSKEIDHYPEYIFSNSI